MAKVVNFSIPYGTTAFGLAGQLGATREFAEELMHTYLARFPGWRTIWKSRPSAPAGRGW